MNKLKFIFLLFVMFQIGCQEDPVLISDQPIAEESLYTSLQDDPLLENLVVKLDDHVSSLIENSNGRSLNNAYDLVDWNKVIRDRKGDLTKYTASINYPEADPNGYENVVLTQEGDKNYAYVVRYEPEEGAMKSDLSDFTGKIQFKDLSGNVSQEFSLDQGELQNKENPNGREQNVCFVEITKVITPFAEYVRLVVTGCTGGGGDVLPEYDDGGLVEFKDGVSWVPIALEDPDRNADCSSWQFIPASGGDYQVCGVVGINFDFIYERINYRGQLEVGYEFFTFATLYFEYPRIRANGDFITSGQAATIMATTHDLVEDALEIEFAFVTPAPLATTLENAYLAQFNAIIAPLGGRVSRTSFYGALPINTFRTSGLGNGICP